MSDSIPYLDGVRLAGLLTPDEALRAVEGFFSSHAREAVEVPPRIHLRAPGLNTIGLYMPAASSRYIAVKTVHLMPDRFPSVEAEVFLYDAETGRLLFWGDGKPMTARRTAAVSTAASLRLMTHCRILTLFGAGVQAAAHADAFAAAYPNLERIWAVTRSGESFSRLEAALTHPGAKACLKPCANLAGALGQSDCVITTTPAAQPLFDGDDLHPSAHVVGVGSATHEMNELPPNVFLQGRVWADNPAALEEAGDFRAAIEAGWRPDSLEGDLFDLLGGGAPKTGAWPGEGAGEGTGRTVFKSVGHAAQDLAVLIRLWELMGEEDAP